MSEPCCMRPSRKCDCWESLLRGTITTSEKWWVVPETPEVYRARGQHVIQEMV